MLKKVIVLRRIVLTLLTNGPASLFTLLAAVAVVFLTLVSPGDALASKASKRWELTVYYTPVESYHKGGTPTKVRGCRTSKCDPSRATRYLGTFPSDFLEKVQQEGSGKITDGQHRSTPYLNWTDDSGGYYWLDTAPRSASGAPLVAWQTSAASSNYPYGTTWRVTSCGVNSGDHTKVDPTMCQKVKASTWVVTDRFEEGVSTTNHADLYVGLEDQPNYENTAPQYFDWVRSATTLGSAPQGGSSTLQHSAPSVTPGTSSQPSNAPGSGSTNPSQPGQQQNPTSETPYNQPQSPSGILDNQSQSPPQRPDNQSQGSSNNSAGGDQQKTPSSSLVPQGSTDQQQAPDRIPT